MNSRMTKYKFPVTAPGSGATIDVLALTGKAAADTRRLEVSINSSADSAAAGVAFTYLPDNSASTYRTFTSYSYATANGVTIYDVVVPSGANGLKVTYANSAAVLTTWEGTIAAFYDERAAS